MQLSYDIAPPAGLPGMIFGIGHDTRTSTRIVENDTMFGLGVAKGTAAGKVKAPAAAGDTAATFAGVLVSALDYNPSDLIGKADGISAPSGAVVSVRERGAVYVVVEEDVVQGDPAYLRHAANGAGKLILGAFRKSLDGASATAALVKGASFDGASFSVTIGSTVFKVAPLVFDKIAANS